MITAIGNPVYDYIKTRRAATDGRILSGCSTNAALALSRLGEAVRLIGAVGDDFKEQFTRDLARYGIDHHILGSKETGGFSLVYYDDFGNRTLDLLGRADQIGAPRETWYANARAVLIGPILGEVTFDDIRTIRETFDHLLFCDPQGLIRSVDETGRILHRKVDGIETVLGLCDIVKPNELEAGVLTGVDCRENPYRAARIIKSWGPGLVIVTLAELGSVIYDGTEFIDIPPYEVDLVDATGAGDTYMAGFTYEYLRTGGDLKKAGCFASSVASIMIEQIGPDFELTEQEASQRRDKLLSLTGFKVAVGINART
jgi:sugar/nucleoside kinase (ribokinase family)